MTVQKALSKFFKNKIVHAGCASKILRSLLFSTNFFKYMKSENQSLFFIRHGKLSLPYKSHNEMPFGVIADLASRKSDPSIDRLYFFKLIKNVSEYLPLNKITKIYASPSRRCCETASLISDIAKKNGINCAAVNVLPELKEVNFDLRKICSVSDEEHFDISKINDVVFEAMANGRHCENAAETYKRIDKIFSQIKETGSEEKILFITHDFFMRVIEIYIGNKGIKKDRITFEELRRTHRNGYLSGFAADREFLELLFFSSEKIE